MARLSFIIHSIQSRINVFWGPRLDTIVGPYTHPSLPFSSDPVNLTGVLYITIEKVWNCKCHRRVFRGACNQVKISEGQLEDEARTYGAKRPRIEGKARTEGEARDRAGEGSWAGARWASPQKMCENLNLKPCRQSGAQFKQQFYLFSLLIFFLPCFLFRWEGLWSSRRRRRFIEGRSAEG